MVNPLLAILHPRRIPEVVECLNSITNYDKYYISYYTSRNAHLAAKEYLLNHKEYTHIVLIPDDLIFPAWYIDKLVTDLQDNPSIEVLGCPANFNVEEWGMRIYAVCMLDIPSKNRLSRQFNWIPINRAPKGIQPVAHQGAFCMFISRRLLEQGTVTLQQDLEAGMMKKDNKGYLEIDTVGCCVDVVISHQLAEAGIRQYVDFNLPIKHLKVAKGESQGLLVGKLNPTVELVRKTGDVKDKG
jgi:hypothetical protein